VKSTRGSESGIALILVVWVVTLLLAISGSFLYATRTDARFALSNDRTRGH